MVFCLSPPIRVLVVLVALRNIDVRHFIPLQSCLHKNSPVLSKELENISDLVVHGTVSTSPATAVMAACAKATLTLTVQMNLSKLDCYREQTAVLRFRESRQCYTPLQ